MAIAEDRMAGRNIVELVETQFISDVDVSKDTPSNAMSIPETPESYADKMAKAAQSLLDPETYGMLANDLCPTTGVPDFTRKASLVISNVDLSAPDLSSFKVDKLFNPMQCNKFMNQILASISVLESQLLSVTGAVLTRIENLIGGYLNTIMNYVGGVAQSISNFAGMVTEGIANAQRSINALSNGIKNIITKLKGIGASLRNRLSILDLKEFCEYSSAAGLGFGGIKLLKDLSLKISLKISTCLTADGLMGFVTNLLSAGLFTKSELIVGIMGLFKSKNDTNTHSKLKVLNTLLLSSVGEMTDKDIITTYGKTGLLLSSLSSVTAVSNSPVSEYREVIQTLNLLDPTWNINPITGALDLSNVKGNKYISALADSVMRSTSMNNLGDSQLGDNITFGPTITPTKDSLILSTILALNNDKYTKKDPSIAKLEDIVDKSKYLEPVQKTVVSSYAKELINKPVVANKQLTEEVLVRTLLPNGDIQLVSSSGYISLIKTDGTVIITTTDGTIITKNVDGSIVTLYNDGRVVTKYPDGRVVTISVDGTITDKLADGTVILTTIDGVSVRYNTDGRVIITSPDGTTSELLPGMSITLPDGTVISKDLNGNTITIYADGTITEILADGTIITRYTNGIVVTMYLDGRIITTEGQKTTTEFPDGTIVINDNGWVIKIDINGVMTVLGYVKEPEVSSINTTKDKRPNEIIDALLSTVDNTKIVFNNVTSALTPVTLTVSNQNKLVNNMLLSKRSNNNGLDKAELLLRLTDFVW